MVLSDGYIFDTLLWEKPDWKVEARLLFLRAAVFAFNSRSTLWSNYWREIKTSI